MHPLDRFRFCPACGSSRWTEHNVKSKQCADCGFVYYANPSSATAAFIVNSRRELLVVRRAKDPARGTLDLPGGFADMGETLEEGMRREILEETGLSVDRVEYLFSEPNQYLYSGMVIHTLDTCFLVRVGDDAAPVPADDAADCLWVPVDQLDPSLFGLASIRRAVSRFCTLAAQPAAQSDL